MIAKRKIHKFNFKSEGAHVALVDKAANKQEVLTMKAAEREVQVTLSMKEFLKKFFDLWEEDAAILAGVLGYDSSVWDSHTKGDGSYMTEDEWINSKIDSVQLLKGVEGFNTLPEGVVQKVDELQKQFGDALNPSQDVKTSEVTTSKSGDTTMDTKIDKEELEVLKAAAAEVETLKGLVATMQAAEEAKVATEMEAVVKGYTFVPTESQADLVAHLLKAEDASPVLAALEKARDAIAAATLEETGLEGGDAPQELGESNLEKSANLVGDILKSRQAK